MKGVLLAGGAGTRLHPVTRAVSKQLLPVYDKPLVYYPLSTLMLAGIREVLVVTTPHEQDAFRRLLGDGSDLGMRIAWAVQEQPQGIAQALVIARDWLAGSAATLALGDNVFYGHGLPEVLRAAVARPSGATVFAYRVADPERYGVVEFDARGRALSIEEKPAAPRSRWAVTGLYVYDGRAPEMAAALRPSARGEYEITDLNSAYLARGDLHVERLGRGFAWLDTGTHESLLQASQFVQAIEERQGLKVACVEEIAWELGWIDAVAVRRLAKSMGKSTYARYLLERLADEERPA
ncbi:MAG TPA: glucose-1-phosphate thymidylyltransferase RfbA [Planctomycetota bacterium]|nr:glucose-1-phosphate thymidylyltransferase RfbA [Planctomycetota bacterium]